MKLNTPFQEELRALYRGCRVGARLKASRRRFKSSWLTSTPSPSMTRWKHSAHTRNVACFASWITTLQINVTNLQYVDCSTNISNTLDLQYVNAKYAHRAHPPLGRSNHNLVYLLLKKKKKTILLAKSYVIGSELLLSLPSYYVIGLLH